LAQPGGEPCIDAHPAGPVGTGCLDQNQVAHRPPPGGVGPPEEGGGLGVEEFVEPSRVGQVGQPLLALVLHQDGKPVHPPEDADGGELTEGMENRALLALGAWSGPGCGLLVGWRSCHCCCFWHSAHTPWNTRRWLVILPSVHSAAWLSRESITGMSRSSILPHSSQRKW